MGNIRKLGPILLGTLLLTVGCSANPDKLMDKASESMSGIDSYTLVVGTKMTTEVEGQAAVTVDSTYETKGSLRPETLISMTNATKLETEGTNEEEENVNYVEQTEEGLCYYEKQGETWYKLTVDGMDMLGDMVKTPSKVLQKFMKYLDKYKVMGEVIVDERVCYEIEAQVPSEKFLDVIKEINDIQDLGLTSEAIEVVAAREAEFGGLVIKFYIDKETNTLLKQTMDLSGMMKIGLEEVFKSQGSDSTVNGVTCTMDIAYKDINKTASIEIPEEVHSAQEVE